uniref:Uncharacterized protein n=1 Tax=Arundo donax TaxID=35708 RepID=A0A0A8Z506_ARUDO
MIPVKLFFPNEMDSGIDKPPSQSGIPPLRLFKSSLMVTS